MSNHSTIGVLGAGAWGTALSVHLAKLHKAIRLWGRNASELEKLISTQENKRYLPGVWQDEQKAQYPRLLHQVRR